MEYVLGGLVDPEGEPELIGGKGCSIEIYDGHLGIGITNAIFCADRAMELAKVHGIGCVALKNTTHWIAWRHLRMENGRSRIYGNELD